MRYCTFSLSLSCRIAAVTSYFVKMRLKTHKMATSVLLKFLTLGWDISRTIWRIEVSDGSFFGIFHALSFELNLFFDRSFPLIMYQAKLLKLVVERCSVNLQFQEKICNSGSVVQVAEGRLRSSPNIMLQFNRFTFGMTCNLPFFLVRTL